MNKNHLLILLLFLTFNGLSQSFDKLKFNPEITPIEKSVTIDTIGVQIRSFTGGELMNDILQFEDIQYLKIEFEACKVIGKRFEIQAKEIWNGEIKETNNVYKSSVITENYFFNNDTSSLPIRVIAKHLNDTILKTRFRFPKLSKDYECKAINSNQYKLRSAIDETNMRTYESRKDSKHSLAMEVNASIISQEWQPLLVYMLPFEMNGAHWWGNLSVCGKDVESWGAKFGIEHYVIFEICFKE